MPQLSSSTSIKTFEKLKRKYVKYSIIIVALTIPASTSLYLKSLQYYKTWPQMASTGSHWYCRLIAMVKGGHALGKVPAGIKTLNYVCLFIIFRIFNLLFTTMI